MRDMIKYLSILVAIVFVLGITYADTVQVLVQAYFTVPSNVAFTLWFPGDVSCVSSAVGTCTTAINFTAETDGTTPYTNCTIYGGSEQDDTVPCFRIDNTGNVALNMSMIQNASDPTGVDLWAAKTFAGMRDATHVDINNTDWWYFNSSLGTGQDNESIWLWVNFTSAPAGITTRNLTVRGIG